MNECQPPVLSIGRTRRISSTKSRTSAPALTRRRHRAGKHGPLTRLYPATANGRFDLGLSCTPLAARHILRPTRHAERIYPVLGDFTDWARTVPLRQPVASGSYTRKPEWPSPDGVTYTLLRDISTTPAPYDYFEVSQLHVQLSPGTGGQYRGSQATPPIARPGDMSSSSRSTTPSAQVGNRTSGYAHPGHGVGTGRCRRIRTVSGFHRGSPTRSSGSRDRHLRTQLRYHQQSVRERGRRRDRRELVESTDVVALATIGSVNWYVHEIVRAHDAVLPHRASVFRPRLGRTLRGLHVTNRYRFSSGQDLQR